jgi:hypothetical protein
MEGMFEVDDKRETQGNSKTGNNLPERKVAITRQWPDKPASVIEAS